MDLSIYNKAYDYFNKFVNNNFDVNDGQIKSKLNHTYGVVKCSKYICEKLNLDETNTNIALVIALLHDIGRFDQIKEIQTIREDLTNSDHATIGVKLLFDKQEILKFIDTREYDNIIKTAIANHSKNILSSTGMTEEEILHSKIIRDADKLDGYRVKLEDDIYTLVGIYKEDIENSLITDKVYNDFMNAKTIISRDRKTGIDIWISYIAYFFGLEFKCSYEYVNENDYINKYFDRYDYKLEHDKMEKLRSFALIYLKDKIK